MFTPTKSKVLILKWFRVLGLNGQNISLSVSFNFRDQISPKSKSGQQLIPEAIKISQVHFSKVKIESNLEASRFSTIQTWVEFEVYGFQASLKNSRSYSQKKK